MDLSVLFTAFVSVVLFSLFLIQRAKSRNVKKPPGPKGHFLFGSALKFTNKRYLDVTKLSEEFGEILEFHVFSRRIVVLSSHDVIKEAFLDNADWLSGRWSSGFEYEACANGHGLVLSFGELWKIHRRFSLTVLRDFGLGKSKIERVIQDELTLLRSNLRALEGCPIAPKILLTKAVSNVICSLVFSASCSQDQKFEQIIERANDMVSRGAKINYAYAAWPFLRYLPGDISGLKAVIEARDYVIEYVREKFHQHRETFVPGNIRDYIDAFLEEMQKPDSESRWFNETQLCQAIFDLFLAGMETTTTTLLWGISFLATRPDIQRAVQREIDDAIGDKLPSSSDKLKLRFTEAVICEIQRFAVILPLAVPHTATDTRKLRGYDIQKDTVVISNLWSVHRDAKIWKDPHNFNVQNFLDDHGNLVNTNYLVPFGVGKRVCLGESLARQELLIFLTGLLQQFDFSVCPDSSLPDIHCACTSLVRSPTPYTVFVSPRNKTC